MIQEMEAWILYQPGILDEWGRLNCYTRQKPGMQIADDNNLAGKVVTDIPHPSDVVSVLLGRYFEKVVAGKKRKAKYGKLKTAPALMFTTEDLRHMTFHRLPAVSTITATRCLQPARIWAFISTSKEIFIR